MSKVTIHVVVEDCFQDCPFCSGGSREETVVCTHSLTELPPSTSEGIIDPPDWCRFRH